MPELASDFQTLPPEYQAVLHLVQETHKIAVTPLQLLVGGWSGAWAIAEALPNAWWLWLV